MNTIERLERVFREVFDDHTLRITHDTSVADIPDWDSVATVRLVLSLEEEFNIRLSTDQVAGIKNVASIIQAIEANSKQ